MFITSDIIPRANAAQLIANSDLNVTSVIVTIM